MTHKTKQSALKAARQEMGEHAIEGLDFNIRNTGAGWDHEPIPPANDAAAAAQSARLSPTPLADRASKAKASVAKKRVERKAAAVSAPTRPKTAPSGGGAKPPRRPPAPPTSPTPRKSTKPSAPEGQSKTEMIVGMISTAGGATSKELEHATGWAPHSVRGLLGTLRKRGVNVVSKKIKGEPTIYRITKTPKAAPESVGDVV